MSTHAEAAKSVKTELKKAFPNVKFKVSSKTYSSGNSLRASWVDGPTTKEVNKIMDKYQYGHFDGMTDCYDMTNCRNDIPQVKYVFVDREISEPVNESVFQMLQQSYNLFDKVSSMDETSHELLKHWSVWTAREYIQRIVRDMDLSNGFSIELVA